jgi:predicted Ser/Thr protein kinase
MLEVLQWARAADSTRLRGAFADRIVLIGLASQREASEDVGATPFAAATPLIYVHANVIDNLLRGRFLTRPPGWLYASTLLLVGVALGWGFASLPVAPSVLLLGLAVIAISALNQLLLATLAIDVPPAAALALAPLVYAGIGTHRYLVLERRSRQREAEIREGRGVQQRFLPEALVGQKLAHYTILEKIGDGGMGVVYRGRDQRLERDVAVKVLTGAALADQAMRRRFRREAVALSRLNHPHIATIFDFDSQDGTDFLVMEFVGGTPLSVALERGPLAEAQALGVAIQVAEAMKAAHAGGILHRDLKPGNVMLAPDGNAKVLDFGVAKMLGEPAAGSPTLTESGVVMGTLAYLAPELLFGEPADERTDVYGLGMVLFEMLTGVRPFPDDRPHELMYTILNQAPPEPRVLNAKISFRSQGIVLRALEKEPDKRHATADELLSELREAAATLTSRHPAWAGR